MALQRKGAIDLPSEQLADDSAVATLERVEATPAASQVERLAELKAKQAAPPPPSPWDELTDVERAHVARRWGVEVFELYERELTESLMAYLRPRAAWAPGSPIAYLRLNTGGLQILRDGVLQTLSAGSMQLVGIDITGSEAADFVGRGAAIELPTLTVRVLGRHWPCLVSGIIPPGLDPRKYRGNMVGIHQTGTRGELLLYSGSRTDPLITQSEEIGQIEILSDGRFGGDPQHLPPCPLPEEARRAPKGRMVTPQNYPAAGHLGMGPHMLQFLAQQERQAAAEQATVGIIL